MGMLCAVTFTSNGQLHYANPGELRPEVGDMVLLPTEHGPVAARVVWAAEYSAEDTEGFPVLLGMAGEARSRRHRADAEDQGPHHGRQPEADP